VGKTGGFTPQLKCFRQIVSSDFSGNVFMCLLCYGFAGGV